MKPISTTSTHFVLATFAVLLTTSAHAAEPYSHSHAPLPRLSPPVSGHHGDYYGGHASTFPESVLRGQADVMRASGEQALNTAEALRSLEAAEEHRLDNRVKRLAVRQQREVMARTHRAEMERLKLAQRAEARAARQQEQAETEAAMTPKEKAARTERLAAGKLELARRLADQGHEAKAQEWMQAIVRDYPGTTAALEVSTLLAGD